MIKKWMLYVHVKKTCTKKSKICTRLDEFIRVFQCFTRFHPIKNSEVLCGVEFGYVLYATADCLDR